MEKCFVKAYSSILEFLSSFLLWFPISGQTQFPTSWSIQSISYVGAKISLKRKSRPFSVWMGGNCTRVYPPCLSFNNNTLSFLLCAQVKYQSLFSLHWFDLLPWFESKSVESFQMSLRSPFPQWKQGPIWPRPPACWDSCSDDRSSPQVPWFIFWVNTTNLSFNLDAVMIHGQICKLELLLNWMCTE